MHLRDILLEAGPWGLGQDPDVMYVRVREQWRGARVHMTTSAARRDWRKRRREPLGAAERLAADIERAILAEGGTELHVDRTLLASMGWHLFI